MAVPALKRLAPQHQEFAHQVARLGYLIERIEETLAPGDDPYTDPALLART